MSEPRYTRMAFWVVKIIMLIALYLWYGDKSAEYERDRIMRENRTLQYQAIGMPYFWNGTIYPAVDFNYKHLVVKVKKEPLETHGSVAAVQAPGGK